MRKEDAALQERVSWPSRQPFYPAAGMSIAWSAGSMDTEERVDSAWASDRTSYLSSANCCPTFEPEPHLWLSTQTAQKKERESGTVASNAAA